MPTGISPKLRASTTISTSRKAVLQVENLVKTYGSRTVVDGVSFKVHDGEIVGLLGANGAGKTTTFRMTCGLIPSDSGKIILNGLDVTRWPMHRRVHEGRLGYLPQDRSTFGSLTTEQNLYAAMEFLGYSRSERREKCEELLTQFNLRHVRKTTVGSGGSGGLSGGERRRLEVARALLTRPKILLLDEPFANVDPITVTEFQVVIRNLKANGMAVLITDHNVAETLAITDRSYVVHNGEVLCSGTKEEVLSNPKAREVYFGEKAKPQVDEVARDATQRTEERARQAVERVEQPSAPPIRERRSLSYRRDEENASREEWSEREEWNEREEEARSDRSGLRLRRRGSDAPPRQGRAKLDFKRRRNDWDE